MIRMSLGALVSGGVLCFFAYEEWKLSSASSAQAEEITLKDLIARGPQGNPNIILTDYTVCDNFIYEEEKRSKRWSKVWVPAIPDKLGAEELAKAPPPGSIRAIIKSTRVRNETDLANYVARPTKLPGMVTNQIESLGYKEKKLLEESYPGTDFSTCLIIEESREPAGSLKLFLLSGGGGALILLGVGLLVMKVVRR